MENLFEIEQEPEWKQEWKDMPEFVQDKKEPHATKLIQPAKVKLGTREA